MEVERRLGPVGQTNWVGPIEAYDQELSGCVLTPIGQGGGFVLFVRALGLRRHGIRITTLPILSALAM